MKRSGAEPSHPPHAEEARTNKPVHEIRIGLIKASIWERQLDNGVMHNTTFSRSYRTGDTWRNTDSYGREDLLTLSKLADMAHTWIWKQQATRQQR